jgi:hypothetical protein
MDGEHATSDEVAYHAAFADIAITERLARRTAAAIGTKDIGCAQPHLFAAVAALRIHLNSGPGLAQCDHSPAWPQCDRRQRGGLFSQHVFNEYLRDPMRQFSRAP